MSPCPVGASKPLCKEVNKVTSDPTTIESEPSVWTCGAFAFDNRLDRAKEGASSNIMNGQNLVLETICAHLF